MSNFVEFPKLGIGFTVNRVAFSIGDFNVYWYGVLIGLGMLLALLFAFRKAKEFGIDEDRMIDVILLTTVCAVLCARAYYVIFAPFEYQSVWDMINFRDGGLAIYGAVIGAFLFGYPICKWRKVPALPMFDLTAMGFLIGQGIGRWGNFVNQEAFGTNTSLPWGMYSPATESYLTSVQATLAAEGVMVNPAAPVHPTFLYESLWCLIGFLLLLAYHKRRRFDGEIMLFYVMWYGLGRFVIEGLRTDSLMTDFLGLRTSQLVAAVSVLAAFGLWVYLRKKGVRRISAVPQTANTAQAPQSEGAVESEAQTALPTNPPEAPAEMPADDTAAQNAADDDAQSNPPQSTEKE
ncbi:MAG: prolipoprotein diacylglyceryl transferase [Oscillospiraceae bacterium]|nr:prolipoprotein diacylglyceryl transferase [Oscillospiraceae bacterium]